MALFFDAPWFDTRLAATGLSRADVATALGLSQTQIDELWKDQRELKASDVRIIAALIGADAREVAARAGVSTPVPKDAPEDALAAIEKRLARVEAMLAELNSRLAAREAGDR